MDGPKAVGNDGIHPAKATPSKADSDETFYPALNILLGERLVPENWLSSTVLLVHSTKSTKMHLASIDR